MLICEYSATCRDLSIFCFFRYFWFVVQWNTIFKRYWIFFPHKSLIWVIWGIPILKRPVYQSLFNKFFNRFDCTCAFFVGGVGFHSVVFKNVDEFASERGNVLLDFVDIVLGDAAFFALLLFGRDVAANQHAHHFHVTHVRCLSRLILHIQYNN